MRNIMSRRRLLLDFFADRYGRFTRANTMWASQGSETIFQQQQGKKGCAQGAAAITCCGGIDQTAFAIIKWLELYNWAAIILTHHPSTLRQRGDGAGHKIRLLSHQFRHRQLNSLNQFSLQFARTLIVVVLLCLSVSWGNF